MTALKNRHEIMLLAALLVFLVLLSSPAIASTTQFVLQDVDPLLAERNWIFADLPEGAIVFNNLEDFIDQLSDLHNESDIGTHSNPAAMQALDGIVNTIANDNITIPEQLIEDPLNETPPYNQSAYQSWRLDLEGAWTDVDFDEISAELCVFGGTQAEESLKVDIWDNDGWINVIPDVMPGWNNVSIAPSVVDESLEMRFTGSNIGNTSIQNSWDIDAVLLHTWTTVYGSKFTQNGIIQDLGNGLSRYIASVGETNTWNEVNETWHRYLYDPDAKTVQIGNLTITHLPGGDLSIDGDAGSRVGKLSWFIQAYYNDQWNNITLDNYQFVGFTKTADNITAHQRFWGTQGEMNVYLTYSYFGGFKTRVDIRNDAAQAVPIRAIWAARDVSGIQDNYQLLRNEDDIVYGIQIEDAVFSWNDVIASDNPLSTQTVIDKPARRAAVIFGNQSTIIPSGYTATIDPDYSMTSDAYDNYWDYFADPADTDVDNADANKIETDGSSFTYASLFAAPVTIAPYSVVTAATLTVYVISESGANTVNIQRIDSADVGVLDNNINSDGGSPPTIDTTPTGTLLIGATGPTTSQDIGKLVQESINEAGWASGNRMGFRLMPDAVCAHTIEDYQRATSNHAKITITYVAPSANWLAGYDYRQAHSVDGKTGAGTDYQIEVAVEYGSGTSADGTIYTNEHCDTDFDDIRFTDNDGETELDYWMEEKTDSDDATFWVEVIDDLGSDQVIYCYYGKSGDSTTSSGTNTFLFYEDWASQSWDGARWTDHSHGTGGSTSYSTTDANHGYVAKVEGTAGGGGIGKGSIYQSSAPYSTMGRVKIELTAAAYQRIYVSAGLTGADAYSAWMSREGVEKFSVTDDGNVVDDTVVAQGYYNSWQTFQISRSGTQSKLWFNHAVVYTGDSNPDTDSNEAVYLYVRDSEYDLYADWVAVRKFIATEPAHYTWANEQEKPNNLPTNDGTPTIATLDDSTKLYSRYRKYEVTTYHRDLDGYADINYVNFYVVSNDEVTTHFSGRFTQNTHAFSELATGASNWELDLGGSTYSEHDTTELDITWKFYVEWDCPDVTNLHLRCFIIDEEPESDADFYGTAWDIETDLEYDTTPTVTDDDAGTVDRGDLDETFHITGDVSYQSSTLTPPSGDVDVWAAMTAGGYGSNVGPWEDDTVDAGGAFDVTCYADNAVGLETYTVKVVDEGTGYGGTDLVDGADPTDTYIADRIVIQTTVVDDARVDIDGNAEIRVTASLEYTGGGTVWLGSGDTITLDGVSMSWDPGNSWWELARSQSEVGKWNYYVNSSLETGYGITGLDTNSQSVDVIWDRINVDVAVNMTWTVIGYYINVSYTGTYEYDSALWSGYATVANTSLTTGGVVHYEELTFSTMVNKTFYATAIEDAGGYGLTVLESTNTVWCVFDDVVPSGAVAHSWVQYSATQVYLIWGIGSNWKWDYNDTLLNVNAVLHAYSNGSSPEASGGTYGSGAFGGLTVGPYTPSWHHVNLTANCEVTINSISYDWQVWDTVLDVDILHTIHIEDSGMDVQDTWITFYFHTNWNNATFYVWDNNTLIGGSLEGWYQVVKPTTVGLHNYTILVNGTQGTIDTSKQTKDFSSSDSWDWLNFKFTVNPVVLTIIYGDLDVAYDEVAFSGTASKPADVTIYEDDVQVGVTSVETGTFAFYWTRASAESAGNVRYALKFVNGTDIVWQNGSYAKALITAFKVEQWWLSLQLGVESYVEFYVLTSWENATVYVYDNETLMTTVTESEGGVYSYFWMSESEGLHTITLNITHGATVHTRTRTFYIPDWAATGLVVRWDLWTFQDNYTMLELGSNWMNCTYYIYLNSSLVATSANDPVILNFTRAINIGTYNMTIFADGGAQTYTIKNIRYIITEEGVTYDYSSVTGGRAVRYGDVYEGDTYYTENPPGYFVDQTTAAIISVGGFLMFFVIYLAARHLHIREILKTERIFGK